MAFAWAWIPARLSVLESTCNVKMPWSFGDVTSLVEKAFEQSVGPIADRSRGQASGGVPGGPQSRQFKHLDSYAGSSVPG